MAVQLREIRAVDGLEVGIGVLWLARLCAR